MPDSAEIADRVEFKVWAGNSALSSATVKEELQSLIPGADGGEAESLSIEVFECFAERRRMLADKYPFRVSPKRIVPLAIEPDGTVYAFCLALSVVTHSEITPKVRDLIFEQLARSAAEEYFGGIGFQTGAKWREHGHGSFEEMVLKVGSLIGELGTPRTTDQPGGGDGGWDVIIVKPFCDGRYPRLIVGGNCATGKTNWEQKGNETVFPHWFRHFYDREPHGPYMEFFAAPFAADDDQRSRKTGKETFLFDRFRLAEFGKPQVGMVEWLNKKARPEAVQISYI